MSKVSRQFEEIIDEKCRILNKCGTSKGSAIHLAQWMKGQLDNNNGTNTNASNAGTINDEADDTEEEHIEDWSDDKVRERSKELQLIDENGLCSAPPPSKPEVLPFCNDNRIADDVTFSELTEDESKSASKSTTSDSQVSRVDDPFNALFVVFAI